MLKIDCIVLGVTLTIASELEAVSSILNSSQALSLANSLVSSQYSSLLYFTKSNQLEGMELFRIAEKVMKLSSNMT